MYIVENGLSVQFFAFSFPWYFHSIICGLLLVPNCFGGSLSSVSGYKPALSQQATDRSCCRLIIMSSGDIMAAGKQSAENIAVFCIHIYEKNANNVFVLSQASRKNNMTLEF